VDRYDPRSTEDRNRGDSWDRSRGSRGGTSENQRLEALQAAVERLEGGKTFDPKIEASDNLSAEAISRDSAKAEVSRIFQDPTEQRFAEREHPTKESAASH
jgi:hypothetical protein